VCYDGYGQLPSSAPEGLYREALGTILRSLGVSGSIAVEPATIPAVIDAMLPPERKSGFATALRRQRMTKTAEEVVALRRSAEVVAAGQRRLVECLRPGISELQLFSELRAGMEDAAGERVAVAGDLLSGRKRTSAVWGWPSVRTIEVGDAVLADLAPRVGAYWGDSCATVVVGTAVKAQINLFNAARGALELAVSELRPGITAAAAHRMIHNSVRQAGFDYRHHTGHSIGTAVHEHPRLAENEMEMLRAGMVLMVEPGAYNPGVGGARAEWMLHLTETGCEPLAPFPFVANVEV